MIRHDYVSLAYQTDWLSLHHAHFQVKALSQFITDKKTDEEKWNSKKGVRGIRMGVRPLEFSSCCVELRFNLSHLCLAGEKSDDIKSFASCILHKACETQSSFDSCMWKCEKEIEPWKPKTPMSKSVLHLTFTFASLSFYKIYKDLVLLSRVVEIRNLEHFSSF